MAVFTLTLSKKINVSQWYPHEGQNCSISVEADSLTDDVYKNFEKAMSLFNMIDAMPYEAVISERKCSD